MIDIVFFAVGNKYDDDDDDDEPLRHMCFLRTRQFKQTANKKTVLS